VVGGGGLLFLLLPLNLSLDAKVARWTRGDCRTNFVVEMRIHSSVLGAICR
jgi:hypothetical protein